ncbi:DBD Tnp Mut domain-containing protein [Abeliophyllum distichum]|uniref:DBD Tnp Mut domain-containing protein n=1 Tax=Abeliophyllum distichum TaxID=126358 RepID=A0ABD1Q4Q1_9LAMI
MDSFEYQKYSDRPILRPNLKFSVMVEDSQKHSGPSRTFDEEKIIPPECNSSDSNNHVDDDGFLYDTNAHDCVAVGLNANPTIELEAACREELESDYGYCLSEEELLIDYSFNEERNYYFPMCNFKFRPNDDERAQARCKKEDYKIKIWASLNKAKDCIQIKSKNSEHTCTRDRTNGHHTARYISKRYLETFKVHPGWKTSFMEKAVNDDVKLTINNITAWRGRRYAKILLDGSNEHQFSLLRSFAAEIMKTNPVLLT